MYTLKVKYGKEWKQSLHTYSTFEEVSKRIEELQKVGIKTKIVKL